MKSDISKALMEVSTILSFLDDDYKNKIPQKIIDFIENEKDETYIPNIKSDMPLEDQNLLEDTINILALLKLDYLCSDEGEKQELLDILQQNEEKYQETLREKYNPDNIFKVNTDKTSCIDTNETENSLVIIKEKNFIKRLFEKIKKLFKK